MNGSNNAMGALLILLAAGMVAATLAIRPARAR